MAEILKFKELAIHIDVSFWYELERRKLNEWRLDEPVVPLTLWIPSATRLKHQMAGTITVSADSFSLDKRMANQSRVPASVQNFNTVEQLVDLDKKAALNDAGALVTKAIADGNWDQLLQVKLYTFSDLKTHKFSYIASIPALDFGSPVQCEKPVKADTILPAAAVAAAHAHATATAESAVGSAPFVLLGEKVVDFNAANGGNAEGVIVFTDTSNLPEYPGWPLRNIIAALRITNPTRTAFAVLALRDTPQESLVFKCTCEALPAPATPSRTVGWHETKIRHVEMGAMMDPNRLADSSANLNLGLMKWRMMPNIELEELKTTKALLLGSGTLGCNVARHLMMWGVRHITFVDRGAVSYSNPVRQSLFELSDVLAEGDNKIKSIAAANRLKLILPTVNATGVQLTIRMPGHRIDEAHKAEAVEDITKLEQLIKDHDVIYLLTDSRESRWLPTLLATAHDKPVINSALGFDSYVVMRHGLRTQKPDERVGCYFCNDVVAPIDSLTARTLDQQCTVTRPGVSAIASAIAVEILAAIYNHPDRFNVAAYKTDETGSGEGVLGIVPHQIRGTVSDYSAMTLNGPAYKMCTACSDIVVDQFKKEGIDFLIKCLNTPDYMEEITGLKAERERAKEQYANWDDDGFESD